MEFWKLSLDRPEEVLFLTYEDLKGDIISEVKKIAKYIGCPFTFEEENSGVIQEIIRLCSFEHMSNLNVNKTGERVFPWLENSNFFRKGEVGEWKTVLTPSMAEHLDRVFKQKFDGSGLTFI